MPSNNSGCAAFLDITIYPRHTSATRKEVQEKLDIKQMKCGLLLKDLENRGLIIRTGSGKAMGYSVKR